MNMKERNEIYEQLQTRCGALRHGLRDGMPETKWGWYNGHYYKNDQGEYERAEYPIPVITVQGVCDIEINLDSVSLTTKRGRLETLDYSLDKFAGIPFEVFSIEQYLDPDYYAPGMDMEAFRENIRKSQEKELGFSFQFECDVDSGRMREFVQLLRREGFYS
ncbi:hypothetical protein D7X94_09555 [Acutalibacter sp. 1XD8-33]|uniref:hypothetical protein n=1 Tax=Acutalibacter sp. 1XD8-33 TaxID=2320081 RepID=UPI000EA0B04E|nr:hypothetical protein [Acutalibacter sp. 1XD8-33]RKJ40102.1 hypothetical protein D7X94_09555 [Acutalibacter sp. 1XD8-33]